MSGDGLFCEAALEVLPLAGQRLRYELAWRVDVDGGPGPRPAGTAVFQPYPGGLRAVFDYQRPERLLGVVVPFGAAEDRGGSGDLLGQGVFADTDRRLLDLLLGEPLREQMEKTADPLAVAGLVEPRPSWSWVGRLALAVEHLRRSARPVDGLWAADLAATVAVSQSAGPLAEWARTLLRDALPVLEALDPAYAARTREGDPGRLHLYRTLLACTRLQGGQSVGPLLDRLRSAEARSVEQELERLHLEIGQGEPVLVAVAGPAQRLGAAGSVLVDHSLEGLVERADWEVRDHGELFVSVVPHERVRGTALIRRVEVRVTASTPAGARLVGAAQALPEGDDGRVAAVLPLPPDVDPGTLVVVAGRDLPVARLTRDDFHMRQAAHWGAHAADARRRGVLAEWAQDRAREHWTTAGRPDLAGQLGSGDVPSFLVELLDTRELVEADRLLASRDAEMLAVARSVLWDASRAQAARAEAERLSVGGMPLDPLATESLLVAAAHAGDREVRDALDAAVHVHLTAD